MWVTENKAIASLSHVSLNDQAKVAVDITSRHVDTNSILVVASPLSLTGIREGGRLGAGS